MNRTSALRVRLFAMMGWFNSARWLAFIWSIAVIVFLVCHLVNLGAGSLWNAEDSRYAINSALFFKQGIGFLFKTVKIISIGESAFCYLIGAFSTWLGKSELVLRLLPLTFGIATAICILSIAIDLGLGRRAGALAGLVLMVLPVTYEITHRLIPDTFYLFLFCLTWALFLHALHGHKFDKHILPHHKEQNAPLPLPMNGFYLVLATCMFIFVTFVHLVAGVILWLLIVLDLLLAHRDLLKFWAVRFTLIGCLIMLIVFVVFHVRFWDVHLVAPYKIPWSVLIDAVMGKYQLGYRSWLGSGLVMAMVLGTVLTLLRRMTRVFSVWMILMVGQVYWMGFQQGYSATISPLLPVIAIGVGVFIDALVRWTKYFSPLILPFLMGCVFWTFVNGDVVLHRDDTIKSLASLMRRSSLDTKLCALLQQTSAIAFYTERSVEYFSTVQELGASLVGQQFRCIIPQKESQAMIDWFKKYGPQKRSVLESVISMEEPPPEIKGPHVVLMIR